MRKYRPKMDRNEIEREKIVCEKICDVERNGASERSQSNIYT